ncbi:hypothetical protein [Microbacterium rhizosphaerae]|uniref:Uncharacterized protein n=1 Tax=Microbacterium rhizosphaerae TaxID=1678237 RepID=A0ABZ0SMV4_9MICO|nr:hypothetical protein [Microbacterium rhizosphaerae]WPR90458.1 hypothetical protein SM116_03980 [Microbacterium rhizosphaerae]
MQKLYFGSLVVDLTDETADLLWAYQVELAARDRSAAVEIPVSTGGTPLTLRLNLSATTPLAILPVPGFTEPLTEREAARVQAELLDVMRLQLAILDHEDRTVA